MAQLSLLNRKNEKFSLLCLQCNFCYYRYFFNASCFILCAYMKIGLCYFCEDLCQGNHYQISEYFYLTNTTETSSIAICYSCFVRETCIQPELLRLGTCPYCLLPPGLVASVVEVVDYEGRINTLASICDDCYCDSIISGN